MIAHKINNKRREFRVSWARLASFGQLGLIISDPHTYFLNSRNELNDCKRPGNINYFIVNTGRRFYSCHTAFSTAVVRSDIFYILQRMTFVSNEHIHNQSTESADGGVCLKLYRPLVLSSVFGPVRWKKSFSVVSRTAALVTLFNRRCRFCLEDSF